MPSSISSNLIVKCLHTVKSIQSIIMLAVSLCMVLFDYIGIENGKWPPYSLENAWKKR